MRTDYPRNDQIHSPERRSMLRLLGVASLILPAALAACAAPIPPRQLKWLRSHPANPPSPETRYAARLGYRWRGEHYEAVPR